MLEENGRCLFFCIFTKVELPIAMFIFCTIKGSANKLIKQPIWLCITWFRYLENKWEVKRLYCLELNKVINRLKTWQQLFLVISPSWLCIWQPIISFAVSPCFSPAHVCVFWVHLRCTHILQIPHLAYTIPLQTQHMNVLSHLFFHTLPVKRHPSISQSSMRPRQKCRVYCLLLHFL